MLYVMMSLRSQYLGDEPVKARLKSLVRSVDPAAAPHLPVLTPVTSYAHIDGLSPPQEGQNPNKGKAKRKKNRSKNSNSNKGNNSNQGNHGKKNRNANTNNQNSTVAANSKAGTNSKKTAPRQPKPDLSVASFPALSDSSPKVEVVVDGGMESAPKASATSDSASTATTLSSSSSSMAKGSQTVATGGYAAALLRPKPATAASTATEVSGRVGVEMEFLNFNHAHSSHLLFLPLSLDCLLRSQAIPSDAKSSHSSKDKKPEAKSVEKVKIDAPSKPSPLVVKPPTWGGGRSFADVLAR